MDLSSEGLQIGDYSLKQTLGIGTFGKVKGMLFFFAMSFLTTSTLPPLFFCVLMAKLPFTQSWA